MTFSAKITLKYDSTWEMKGGLYDDQNLPEQQIMMQVPAEDLSTIQLFSLFRNFLLSIGYNEFSIMQGACNLAFNDCNNEDYMKKIADEYDLTMNELPNDHWEQRYKESQKQILSLKAKLSRLENPDCEQYTDAEMEAMCAEAEAKSKQELLEKLKSAYKVCKDCGNKYGNYVAGLSSVWMSDCDVCGQHKPVTEARDYDYLKKGVTELSK